MSLATVRELYNETACEHNPKKSEQGCPTPVPGRAAGGCSFDGALISLVPVTDALHVVHGPIGCLGNTWNNRGSLSSGPMANRLAITTNFKNNDVVFGGEKKLYKGLREIIAAHHPPAVFVYQTCVTAMIGDDLQALCEAVSKKAGIPVIPVEAPGFIGTKNFGNRLAGDALYRHVIGTETPLASHPYNINLIGEFNIAGELWNILPLFEQLNIRVICSLSGDARFHQIAMMHHAQINMMVCSRAMLNVARRMKEDYGIPFFEGSFYGIQNTKNAILTIARHFNDPQLLEKAEQLCQQEFDKIKASYEQYRQQLEGKRVLLYTGGVKSWSFVGALQELGMRVVATGTKKSTAEDKQRIVDLMGDNATMIESGAPRQLLDLCQKYRADILMAGGRNQYTALKARIPFVDVNQGRHISFSGYVGYLNLAKTIVQAINNPAFEQARTPAPF